MKGRWLEWVMKTRRGGALRSKVIPGALCGIVALVAAQAIPGCGSDNAATVGGGPTGTGPITGTSGTDGGSTLSCDHPNPGCACSQTGETAPCGKVIARSGDFFQCSEGTTTCTGTTWGACDGDITIDVDNHLITGGGVSIQGLGAGMACGTVNPCDPYCNYVQDTPPGLDAGTGLGIVDGGLTLVQSGATPNLCNEPTSNSSTLANLFASPNSHNFTRNQTTVLSGGPIPCTGAGTAGDTCPMDNQCVGTTCSPYSEGITNTATACTTLPDFTAGMGCWDNGSNLNGLELEVCNRGGVEANVGNLQVDFADQAPTNSTASGCGNDAFPDLLQSTSSPNGGYCTIPLATSPIGPGECLSFNVFSPTMPIACTSVGGGALTTANFTIGATSQIAVDVNPPSGTAFTPAATYIQECDACNNYSTIAANSAGQSYAACTQGYCGAVAGAGGTGGTSCTGSITGQVRDPGLNVGLSNVEVYTLASGATPIVIPDEPANATANANPTCDTCAALNSTIGAGVSTDVNGNFTLTVPNGNYTVIAQIGRWRRVVNNVVVANCMPTALTKAQISMPQTHSLISGTNNCPTGSTSCGDIPKMAVVVANGEALECWLLKVGVAASEFAPHSLATSGQRIHLYESTFNAGEPYWNVSSPYTPDSANNLWASGSNNTINDYSAVILPCDGGPGGYNATPAALTSMVNYVNAGGRLFTDHWPGQTWIANSGNANPAPTLGTATLWGGEANWNNAGQQSSQVGKINDSSADQQGMYNWMQVWDTADSVGSLTSSTPRNIMTSLTGGSEETDLVNFPASVTGTGNSSIASMWFNTPVTYTGTAPQAYCGRVVYNDMHVSNNRGSTNPNPTPASASNTFPGSCVPGCPMGQSCPTGIGLTGEELALEYEMFQLSACNLGTSLPTPPPPVPSPPQPLTSTTFTRTFSASCAPGFGVKWGFFEWEGSIPSGTSITYNVQTSATGMAGSFGAVVPLVTMTTTASTTMYTASPSVDTTLTSAMPPQSSLAYLSVEMTLNPNTAGTIAPTLTKWEQLYDCTP